MRKTPIRLICHLLALGQLLFFAAPANAQYNIYSQPSRSLGLAVGMGMMGGMVGIGALMVGSRMIANHNMYKNHNNPNSNQPKDKAAHAERRRKQELKLKGELESDYQKELAQKGLVPQSPQMPGATNSLAAQGMGGQPFPASSQTINQTISQPLGQGSASPALRPPINASINQSMSQSINPSMNQGMSAPAATIGKENAEGGMLNTPWSPSSDLSPPPF